MLLKQNFWIYTCMDQVVLIDTNSLTINEKFKQKCCM